MPKAKRPKERDRAAWVDLAATKAKKKPAEGSPPKWFIRFPKPKRKAREFTAKWLPYLRTWSIDIPDFVLGQDFVIRVREILPRTPAKKRGKR